MPPKLQDDAKIQIKMLLKGSVKHREGKKVQGKPGVLERVLAKKKQV